MQIREKDIISFEMVTTFYYKNCEVTLKKYNNITVIKIVGLSDMGNFLIDSQTFIEKSGDELIIQYVKNEIRNIEKVYKSITNKEYGNHNSFYFKNI